MDEHIKDDKKFSLLSFLGLERKVDREVHEQAENEGVKLIQTEKLAWDDFREEPTH